jgi:tRNA G18 (ribose-2'-O)-methylase SpoU
MYLVGKTPCPPNRIIRQTARSTEKNVPWKYFENTHELMEVIRNNGYRIISAEITDNSTALHAFQFEPCQKICLIAGSEKDGVSQELLDISDDVIHIPMLGINSSMNVVNALAIITYQIILQTDSSAK